MHNIIVQWSFRDDFVYLYMATAVYSITYGHPETETDCSIEVKLPTSHYLTSSTKMPSFIYFRPIGVAPHVREMYFCLISITLAYLFFFLPLAYASVRTG